MGRHAIHPLMAPRGNDKKHSMAGGAARNVDLHVFWALVWWCLVSRGMEQHAGPHEKTALDRYLVGD